MITYKILRVNTATQTVQIRYSKDNYDDFYAQYTYDIPFTEEKLHQLAKNQIEEAAHHWQLADDAQDLQIEQDTGVVKDRVYEATPDYDHLTQTISPVITETETTEIYGYEVVDLSSEQKAHNIRAQRDGFLFETDIYALSDRVMSDEMIAYRQGLRDMTDQEGFPESVIWPVRPID